MITIYQKIEKTIKDKCPNVHYEKYYPRDYVKLNHSDEEILDDESIDTLTPLVEAMNVIMETVKAEATQDDDLEIIFTHLPGEEAWCIAIGDGR